MKAYVYNLEENKVVAVFEGNVHTDIEKEIAAMGYDRDEYGYTYDEPDQWVGESLNASTDPLTVDFSSLFRS